MGMMTRRNVKARAVKPAPAVVEKKVAEVVQEDAHKEVLEEAQETAQEVAETLAEKLKAKDLSKTDINRMATADLQELAKSFGVEGAEEMSGSQIKRLFVAALED